MPEDSKISKAQQRAVNKYVKNNYDRINVTFPKGQKEVLKKHAIKQNESVNAFIVRAVNETIERDTGSSDKIPTAASPLAPDTLAAAKDGAAVTGETPPQFISRAVKEQVRRDEISCRMGLHPITGDRLKRDKR